MSNLTVDMCVAGRCRHYGERLTANMISHEYSSPCVRVAGSVSSCFRMKTVSGKGVGCLRDRSISDGCTGWRDSHKEAGEKESRESVFLGNNFLQKVRLWWRILLNSFSV